MRRLSALLVVLLPSPALACAVCGAAVERSRMAFVGTTVLLSLLPLAMMAGGLWWLARHARGRLAGEFDERESVPAPGPVAGEIVAPPETPGTIAARPGS
jgi:hypothetical protein